MKKLTRMKLINWHYIVDSTIDFNGSCLITGDNGSGKSTILDAVQYVLTCGRARFNSAAHEKTKRDLLGYVRCKTGNDSNAYVRSGDVSSHVALEFYEDKKKKYFIIGAAIDSSGDMGTPKSLFYRIENKRIEDDFFLNGSVPRNISDFKVKLKSSDGKTLNTQSAAQEDFIHRFGSIGYRFFELFPKALAFRPISNIKDFVYSYLLDEKQVNIEYLKENVKTYMEFEKVLNLIKARVSKLDEIIERNTEIERINENIKIQDYIILRSQKEIIDKELENIKSEYKNLSSLLKNGQLNELNLQEEIDNKKKIADELHRSLLENQTYQLINALENEIKTLDLEYKKLSMKDAEFDSEIKKLLLNVKMLHESKCEIEGYEDFVFNLKVLENAEQINEFVGALSLMERSYKKLRDEHFTKRAEMEIEVKKLSKNLEQVEKDVEALQNKQLVYDEKVIRLKCAITDELKLQTGKEVLPRIICELLQIKDELWKDAVEGYLNTQRFNLIVEPEYFDISVDTYERVKRKRNIHSVGLINTQKLEEYGECPEDSLAYIVSSNNKYAKLYANMILGKVTRCSDAADLKKYKCSITPSCMVYQNSTVRQINPDIYNKPYIGEDAYKKQLELKQEEQKADRDRISELNLSLMAANNIISLLDNPRFEYIRENCSVKLNIKTKKNLINEKKGQLSRVDKSTILNLQLELEDLNKAIGVSQAGLREIIKKNIKFNLDIEQCQVLISQKEIILKEDIDRLGDFEKLNVSIVSKAKERYEENIKNRSAEAVFNNFSKNRKGLETQYSERVFDMMQLQRDYNREFHFGGAEGIAGMGDFYREHKNLKESKVIEYEEKIKSARVKAEEEFKEHFLAKLQENIVSAQNEFKKLNEALKGIKFGEDEYKFQCLESKEYEDFYKMIMDDSNLPGFNLFSGSYREKHKKAMDELFERITIDDENSKKALEKFTDYRTFMDYDIKIYHGNGNTSTFSKVCREKSGGETQTPYYVAIAASFVQLYDSGLNDESIGLILFDEAFDKMDENRIESMMQFLNKLSLQVIIAAPPQKIESIAQYVGTTLIVFKEDDFSFVEALYQNEKLQ